jgi:hypothetical protein
MRLTERVFVNNKEDEIHLADVIIPQKLSSIMNTITYCGKEATSVLPVYWPLSGVERLTDKPGIGMCLQCVEVQQHGKNDIIAL